MRVSFYCTCGAAMNGTITPDERAERILALFRADHSGEGHAPCDSRTASRAREREDRELAEMSDEEDE